MAATARRRAKRAARTAQRSRAVRRSARFGLAGRGVFYLVLAALTARVAANGGSEQADANGALRAIAMAPLGDVLLVAAAAGFAAYAGVRLVAAVTALTGADQWWPVLRAAAEGVAYAVIAVFTVLFVLGSDDQGSDRSTRAFTARLLDAPAGRVLVAAIALAVIGFYLGQLWRAMTQPLDTDLDEKRMPRWLRVVARVTGTTGITARVIAFLPIGVFLLIAAVTHDAGEARGLDATLSDTADTLWGLVLLVAVTVGFTAFAVFSFLEAAYRKVSKA